jgi:hypothetical protein
MVVWFWQMQFLMMIFGETFDDGNRGVSMPNEPTLECLDPNCKHGFAHVSHYHIALIPFFLFEHDMYNVHWVQSTYAYM